ncbi:hypothetical protein BH24DEI2_BH24DEI2_03560 [soil metagenome]
MSETIATKNFVDNLFTLLVETFESPPRPGSAYLDQKAGLFDTLEAVSAEQASRPIVEGGTSIAAQLEHTRFYLDVIEQFMNGRTEKVDWQESWLLGMVTPEAWERLKQALKDTYESVTAKLKSVESWGDDEVGDGMAMLVHTAYHLGTIRQMMKVVA